jgi:hypothetical protein
VGQGASSIYFLIKIFKEIIQPDVIRHPLIILGTASVTLDSINPAVPLQKQTSFQNP